MKLKIALTAAVMTLAFGLSEANAQLRETQPAEFPPASYKGKQYVDSNGCVFIRAGIDGDVSWVPRVSRSRQVVCGFTPTLGATRTAAAPRAPIPAAAPAQITIDNAPAAAAPAPAPAPRQVRRAATPAPVVVRQTAPAPRVATPRRVVVAPAPPPQPVATAPAPVRQTALRGASACPGASAISQRYLRSDGRTPVRCGPQAAPIVAPGRVAVPSPGVGAGYAPAATAVTAQTRIVPKHVAVRRLNTTNVTVPPGYKQVWEDGRLNPKRAEQTLEGRGQMLLIWTNTVPRRLINQSDGRDVTASVPLVYPYLDVATQRRELGEVTIVERNGQRMKRVVRNPGAAPVLRQPVYSSRSTPARQAVPANPARAAAKPAATGPARYVEIGLFSTKAKAYRAVQQLSGLGMGARMGTVRRAGQTFTVVQAGPFHGAAAQRAMTRLRGAGYSGAALR